MDGCRALILIEGRSILTGIPKKGLRKENHTLLSVSGSAAGAVLPGNFLSAQHNSIEISGPDIVAASAKDIEEERNIAEQRYPLFDWAFRDLCQTLADADETGYGLLSRGASLLYWHQQTRYCGVCGNATVIKSEETAKRCTGCGNIFYPRISPAIIVAVMRNSEILLAHGRHFSPGLYSLIAGFVESGETLEEAVHREVQEEVGVQVKNLRYVGSQPWAFPDSLMTGFIAEYAGGEIRIDDNEIDDAHWFSLDALPLIPESVSIAGKIIRGIIKGNRP